MMIQSGFGSFWIKLNLCVDFVLFSTFSFGWEVGDGLITILYTFKQNTLHLHNYDQPFQQCWSTTDWRADFPLLVGKGATASGCRSIKAPCRKYIYDDSSAFIWLAPRRDWRRIFSVISKPHPSSKVKNNPLPRLPFPFACSSDFISCYFPTFRERKKGKIVL